MTVIAGQMTPVCQLTDVMSAKICHELAAEFVKAQGQLLRRKAIQEGIKPVYKYGKREIVGTMDYVQRGLVERARSRRLDPEGAEDPYSHASLETEPVKEALG